jgi:hypothetical protein
LIIIQKLTCRASSIGVNTPTALAVSAVFRVRNIDIQIVHWTACQSNFESIDSKVFA